MFKPLLSSLTALLLSPVALADWSLDNEFSRVSFVSVKKNSIGEAHYFKNISGKLTDTGNFTVNIHLASVETLIPIRNERIAKHLFKTNLFPTLNLHADLSKYLPDLKIESSTILKIPASITLNDMTKNILIEVLVTQQNNGNFLVSSFMPVIINPVDFNLTAGLNKLQALANLPSITHSVPVSFTLTLQKE